jgi:hypothetical protein
MQNNPFFSLIHDGLINLDAQITQVENRIAELETSPRADATIWQRPGSGRNADDPEHIAYYLVHRQGSEHLENGGKRRQRVGKGPQAKAEAEQRIANQEELQQCRRELKQLQESASKVMDGLRRSVYYLGLDQPDGAHFYPRSYSYL